MLAGVFAEAFSIFWEKDMLLPEAQHVKISPLLVIISQSHEDLILYVLLWLLASFQLPA